MPDFLILTLRLSKIKREQLSEGNILCFRESDSRASERPNEDVAHWDKLGGTESAERQYSMLSKI